MIDVLLAVPVPRRRHRVFCNRDSGKQIPSIFRAIFFSAAHAGRAQAAAVPFAGHRAPVPPGPPLDNRQRATLAALCLAGRHGSPKLGCGAHATLRRRVTGALAPGLERCRERSEPPFPAPRLGRAGRPALDSPADESHLNAVSQVRFRRPGLGSAGVPGRT